MKSQERLKANFQLISENSKLNSKAKVVTDNVAKLREEYIYNIQALVL